MSQIGPAGRAGPYHGPEATYLPPAGLRESATPAFRAARRQRAGAINQMKPATAAVLRANRLDGREGRTPVWTSRVRDEWMRRQEMGQHDRRAFMFHVAGGRLVEDAIDEPFSHTPVPRGSPCAQNPPTHT